MPEKEEVEEKEILKGVALYLDISVRTIYTSSYFHEIAMEAAEVEKPYRKTVDEPTAADLGISYFNDEEQTFLPLPSSNQEAFDYLKNLHGPQALVVLKTAFMDKYGTWENKSIIREEIKKIERFISFVIANKSYGEAFEVKKPHTPNNADSKIDYICTDTSYAAEYLRLQNGFYQNYFYEGSMYSNTALIYALCELFLQFLKLKLIEEPLVRSNDEKPMHKNDSANQTLRDIWQSGKDGKKEQYDESINLLQQRYNEIESPFVKKQHGSLYWIKTPKKGYVQYLAAFIYTCIDRGWLLDVYSAPQLKTILQNTFNIDFDHSPLKQVAANPPEEKYLTPFKGIPHNI